MERIVSYQYTELIQAGFDLIPQAIADRLRHIQFFAGANPVFAVLIDPRVSENAQYLCTTWCVSYPWRQTVEDRRTTVIMTDLIPTFSRLLRPVMVVHELGHCLHEVLDFEPMAKPVTKYAQKDEWEAFAEAFTLWVFPEYGRYYDIIARIDDKTMALFTQLIRN